MKTKIAPIIALLLALISGVFAWQQRQGVQALKQQTSSLIGEVANKDDALREHAALLDRLQEENAVYSKEFAALREKAFSHTSTTPVQDPENNSSSSSSETAAAKVFSKMAKDPRLKEVTRQWQRARIKKVYRDFVRARRLDPQQTKQFFDLLVKDDMRSTEEGAQLLSGDETETGANKLSSVAEKEEIERQLKFLLGDNGYAEYEEYKQSTSDRLTLLQIQEHFARTSAPLRPDQANTLLQIMLEEHGLNQSVLDRIETVLTPEQSQELERFQDANRQLLKLRTDAALEMMNRKKMSATPAPSR
jgi:hypothetical protein